MVAAQAKAEFLFPVRELESARVNLTVFDPTSHAKELIDGSKAHPELYHHFPFGPFDSVDEYISKAYNKRIAPDPGIVLFAIYDKTKNPPRFAGVIGLLNTSVVDQVTEIGFIVILPAFQRTHVTTNAVGLLLHYCLEPPNSTNEKYGPGLGLRRVQWQTHGDNVASLRAAERMGFKREGLIRWQRILQEGKEGPTVPPERAALCSNPGRHSWMLAICWDDWELEGTREFVQERMERV